MKIYIEREQERNSRKIHVTKHVLFLFVVIIFKKSFWHRLSDLKWLEMRALYAFVRPSEKLLRQCAMCLKNRRIGRWWSESLRSDCGAKKGVVEFHATVETCWTLKKHGDWIRWPPKQLVQGQPLIEAMKSVWCMLSRLTDTNTALCKRISHFWICRWSCTCWCWLGADLNPVHRLDTVCKRTLNTLGTEDPRRVPLRWRKLWRQEIIL